MRIKTSIEFTTGCRRLLRCFSKSNFSCFNHATKHGPNNSQSGSLNAKSSIAVEKRSEIFYLNLDVLDLNFLLSMNWAL